jgi:hypothetical protein
MEDLDLIDIGPVELGVEVARKHGVDLLVGQFARTLDDTLTNPCFFIGHCTSVGVDLEDNTDSEPIFAWEQRANFRSDLWWEHRATPVIQIDCGASLTSFAVYKRVCFNEVSDISNVDTDLDLSIDFSLDVDGIIKLVGSIGVNREGLFITEVAPSSDGSLVFLLQRPFVEANAACDGIREVVGCEVVVSKKGIGLDLQLAHLTKLLDEGAEGVKRSNWPSLDACNEDSVGILLVLLYKVPRSLLCWNGNKWDSFAIKQKHTVSDEVKNAWLVSDRSKNRVQEKTQARVVQTPMQTRGMQTAFSRTKR